MPTSGPPNRSGNIFFKFHSLRLTAWKIPWQLSHTSLPPNFHKKTNKNKSFLMNKVELVAAVQKTLGSSKADAERALAAVLDGIKLGIKKTKNVQLIGFGTFKVANRKARKGINPKTGAAIKIKASKSVKFAAGKAFKSAL